MKAVCARLTSYGLLALMSEHLNTQIHCTCVPLQCAICIKHISCSKWQIMFVSFKLNVLDSIYTVSFTPIGNYLLWFVQGRIEGGGATNQVSFLFSLCDGYLYKVILYWRIWEDLLCSSIKLDASWYMCFIQSAHCSGSGSGTHVQWIWVCRCSDIKAKSP